MPPVRTALPSPVLPRLGLLLAGLALYGFSLGLMVVAGLGLAPWAVLDQGLSRTTGISLGTASIAVGAVLLLLWVPLHQRPGVGTVCNVVLVGVAIDLTLVVLPVPETLPVRLAALVAGVVLNGVATGAYIGAGLGPGPRDGLTTGIAARGRSIRVVRTGIEVTVLAAGWVLGGTVGLGTLLYALAIGPLMHATVPALALRPRR